MPNDDWFINANEVYDLLMKQAMIDSQPRAIRRAARMVIDFPAADVEPKRKTGVWTEENMCFDAYVWRCSVCKEDWDIIGGTPFENDMRFCPKCGAEMIAEAPKGEQNG